MSEKIDVTRKTFQELTGLKYIPGVKSVLCKEVLNRWNTFKSVLSFTERCLMPETKDTSVVCITSDVSKARSKAASIKTDVNYILAKSNEFTSMQLMEDMYECISDKYKDSKILFFENLRPKELGIALLALHDSIESDILKDYTVIYTVESLKDFRSIIELNALAQRCSVVVSTSLCEAYVHKSSSLMDEFNYPFKCIS